jgi:hypothetical protein
MAQSPRVVAQTHGVHTNLLSRYRQATRACECGCVYTRDHDCTVDYCQSFQCPARIPSACGVGGDVADALRNRFAPRRGRDVSSLPSIRGKRRNRIVPSLVVALLARLDVSNPPKRCPTKAPSRPERTHTQTHTHAHKCRQGGRSKSVGIHVHPPPPCWNMFGSRGNPWHRSSTAHDLPVPDRSGPATVRHARPILQALRSLAHKRTQRRNPTPTLGVHAHDEFIAPLTAIRDPASQQGSNPDG